LEYFSNMKIIRAILSTRTSLVLLVVFALAMAVATFVENDHGTKVARAWIYEAWWFEIVMVWLAVNFLAHVKQYRLLSPSKWPIGLFHIGFVVTVIGAGITRYFSTEGIMHIRQGEEKDFFYSSTQYIQLIDLGGENISQIPLNLTEKDKYPRRVSTSLGDQGFDVTVKRYIKGAQESFVPGDGTFLSLATLVLGERQDFLLPLGKELALTNSTLRFGSQSKQGISILKIGDSWIIQAAEDLQVMDMTTQQMGILAAGNSEAMRLRTLYQWESGAIMFKGLHENSKLVYLPEPDEKLAENLPNMVEIEVAETNGNLLATHYFPISTLGLTWQDFATQGQTYRISYGPKKIQLPFTLYLNAFELERYPGSESPSSYASEVMVQHSGEEFPYRIFMNNVLDFEGYRFYQSSYDSDERGTILSVNQDRPGTYVTYLGYFLLSLGMLLSLFAKGSRFALLNKRLDSSNLSRETTTPTSYTKPVFASLALFAVFAIWGMVQPDSDKSASGIIPQKQSDAYGRLIVQDLDGRMKPLNTLANEIVRKLSGKTSIEMPWNDSIVKMNPEQFMLHLQMDPPRFSTIPLIKIDREKSLEVFKRLKKDPSDMLAFNDFLDTEGNYLIQDLVEQANQLKPSERNEGHKELLKTDERFNIFYGLLVGDFLRIFPNKLDPANTWFTGQQYRQGFAEDDGLFVQNITPMYLQSLGEGLESGNWEKAEEVLSYIDLYQRKAGAEVYPTDLEVKAELLYNRMNLTARLFGLFWLLGIVVFVVALFSLFHSNHILSQISFWGKILAWIGFLAFTFHLGLRWYIAKHPPWTDGFEMLVFVAWGVLLFGLLFASKTRFAVPLGLLFSGTLLFVGFLDWLNPEITNLMPVLHSYWLKIHVAVIVSGYAPLALGAILALVTLFLIVFQPKNPSERWTANIREMQMVNEMSLTVGLFLLTIGTFLGGVWANESWGRYWAWDPKETWALISVMVYAFVLHLRLIPATRNALVFNLASLWAFSSIIMTSFGVNYYLSGLHSYAKGDPVPVPMWVTWTAVCLLVLSLAAIWYHKKMDSASKTAINC
jgi:cytochrome c-type biogenesis protein CcsB